MTQPCPNKYSFAARFIFTLAFLTTSNNAHADTTIKYRCHYDDVAMKEIVSVIDVDLTGQHFVEGPPVIRQMRLTVGKPAGGNLGQETYEFVGYPIREQLFVDGKLTTKRYSLGGSSLSVAVPGIAMGAHGYAIWANFPNKSAKCVQR